MNILLVDDEAAQRSVLSGYLKKKKHNIYEAADSTAAVNFLKSNSIDIVLTDLKMPGKSGMDLLKEVKGLNPLVTVILITAFGTIEGAVDAMREGAYDYLTKPIDLEELDLLIQRIDERNRLISENQILKEQLAEKFSFEGIISQSSEMSSILQTAARVASSDASVLIQGESGTGKELVARAIHYSSQRKNKPFVPVNCAALNENILESELFGHEKGAFTGADRQRPGRFEAAKGGTIFLDEIGDISPAAQIRLLRVLQERKLERVGGNETIEIDVRVIAATNQYLKESIQTGKFREDLYYRLNVVGIEIPPLRDRRQDIAPLLDFFLDQYARENRRKKMSFSREALEALLRYDYPGNVRELQNIVQRSVVLGRRDVVTLENLPAVLKGAQSETKLGPERKSYSLSAEVERLEKDLVLEALRINQGNQSKAARHLGISERNLRYRLKKWRIK